LFWLQEAGGAGDTHHISARGAEGWVLARASGARRLYVLVESRHATLAEAQQALMGLVADRFSHIFLDGG